VPVGDFFSSEDGQCYDDMNAMLWQLYFNVAMKSDLEGEEGTVRAHVTSRALQTRGECHHGNCAGSIQSNVMLCLLLCNAGSSRQHTRPAKHKLSSEAGSAVDAAASRFVSRVVMRGVT
jgi:hypothetical protein